VGTTFALCSGDRFENAAATVATAAQRLYSSSRIVGGGYGSDRDEKGQNLSLDNTTPRLAALDEMLAVLKPHCSSTVLTGSMAYGAHHSVRASSDIDLLLVVENSKGLFDAIDRSISNGQLETVRFFRGGEQ
jgi:hypothetical protein